MIGGPLTLLFILVLLVALAVPLLRLFMALVVAVLILVFLYDILVQQGVWIAILIDELVSFWKALFAAFDAFLRSLPR